MGIFAMDVLKRNGDLSDNAIAQVAVTLNIDGAVEVRWMGDVARLVRLVDPSLAVLIRKVVPGLM